LPRSSEGATILGAYNDYLQLLQDPAIDAVVIATPEHLHDPILWPLLKQGRTSTSRPRSRHQARRGNGLIHYVRAYWYRNSLEDNPVWRYKVPDDANPRNSQGDRSHARGQEAAISRPVATLSLRNNKKGQPVTQVSFCIAPERVPPATAASGVKLL